MASIAAMMAGERDAAQAFLAEADSLASELEDVPTESRSGADRRRAASQ